MYINHRYFTIGDYCPLAVAVGHETDYKSKPLPDNSKSLK